MNPRVRSNRWVSSAIVFLIVVSGLVFIGPRLEAPFGWFNGGHQAATPSSREATALDEATTTTIIEPLEYYYPELWGVENVSEPRISGYIVEFHEKPVLAERAELLAEIKDRERELSGLDGGSSLAKVLSSEISSLKTQLPGKLASQKKAVSREQEDALKAIETKLPQVSRKVKRSFTRVFNGMSLDISADESDLLKTLPEVKGVYPNLEVSALLMDSVPLINADEVWQLDSNGDDCSVSGNPCLTGEGMTIAIIDTGIDYTHSDLGSCTREQFLSGNCEKVIGGYDFVNDDPNPLDNHYHGTHCASIAGGNGALKGVAPNAGLYAFKVLNQNGCGFGDDIIAAVERSFDLDGDEFIYGVDPEEDEPEDILDVISLSLGGRCENYDEYCGPDDPMSQAIDTAVDNGIIAVVAAGNSGPEYGTIGTPATARKAITVGATCKPDDIGVFPCSEGEVAEFSSRGFVEMQYDTVVKPDVVAPGRRICAAKLSILEEWMGGSCFDERYFYRSGTSMAAPHVAGAAALLKQAHPDWGPDEIKSALMQTAVDLGESLKVQGYGKIDVLAALRLGQIAQSEVCTTVGDEDGNGLADCEDPACPLGIICNPEQTRRCKSGSACSLYEHCEINGDEDGDDLADCADVRDCPDLVYCNPAHTLMCNSLGVCAVPEDCQAPGDEDGDGLADCADVGSCPEFTFCDGTQTKKCVLGECREVGVPLSPQPCASQYHPHIYGNYVVWHDDRFGHDDRVGNADIFLYDLSTGVERQITDDSWVQRYVKIFGGKIVWQDNRNDQWQVYLYDLSTETERQITDNPSASYAPKIYGNNVIYSRSGKLFRYDIEKDEEQRVATIGGIDPPRYADIYEDKIVYLSSGRDIYLHHIDTGYNEKITTITDSLRYNSLKIYGDKLLWLNYNQDGDNNIITLFYLKNKTKEEINTGLKDVNNPHIFDNRVVFQAIEDIGRPNNIYYLDIPTNEIQQISFESDEDYDPQIWGGRIVWYRAGGMRPAVYFFELPVEVCELPGDEDEDELIDCDDVEDCPTGAYCNINHTMRCNVNNICMPVEDCAAPGDEDGDSLADCADLEDCYDGIYCNPEHTLACNAVGVCTTPEDCETPGDEDADGLYDCLDEGSCYTKYCNPVHTKRCIEDGVCISVPVAIAFDSGQQKPDISGELVVWQDYRNNNWDIYSFNLLSDTEQQITDHLGRQDYPYVSGDTIVWKDSRHGYYDVYSYRVSTGVKRRITPETASSLNYAVSGDNIVWNDWDDVYLYNPETGIRLISSSAPYRLDSIDISGETIVWSTLNQIFVYDLTNDREQDITDSTSIQDSVSVSGDKLVGLGTDGIYLFYLADDSERYITDDIYFTSKPIVSGDYIVWKKNDGIYLFDLSTGVEQKISGEYNYDSDPRVSDGRIVWERDSDIYLYEMPEEVCESPGDEDGDSLADCADVEDCSGGVYCNPEHTRVCSGGVCVYECTDSDGGRDYYVRGTARGDPSCGYSELTDFCAGGGGTGAHIDMLAEAYCTPEGCVYREDYICPFGCSEGACNPITNCVELQEMRNDLSGVYVMDSDIDCSATNPSDPSNPGSVWDNGGLGFEPVGDFSDRFTGTFDGQGHTITGLYINRPSSRYVGLFGSNEGSIINVGLLGVSVTGYTNVAGLAALNKGVIANSFSSGSVATVVGDYNAGGLVGYNGGNIRDSYSTVDVVAGGNNGGGLAGLNNPEGRIMDSHAAGDVSAYRSGGLVGYNQGGTIVNSFATGGVTGSGEVGGLVGFNLRSGVISNCYFNNHAGNPGVCVGVDDSPVTDCTAVDDNVAYFFDVVDTNPPYDVWGFPPWDVFCDDVGYPPLAWEGLSELSECRSYTMTTTTLGPYGIS